MGNSYCSLFDVEGLSEGHGSSVEGKYHGLKVGDMPSIFGEAAIDSSYHDLDNTVNQTIFNAGACHYQGLELVDNQNDHLDSPKPYSASYLDQRVEQDWVPNSLHGSQFPSNSPDHDSVVHSSPLGKRPLPTAGNIRGSHLTRKSNRDRHQCSLSNCRKSFTRLSDLQRHQNDKHRLGNTMYQCNGCEYAKYGRRDKVMEHCTKMQHGGFSALDLTGEELAPQLPRETQEWQAERPTKCKACGQVVPQGQTA